MAEVKTKYDHMTSFGFSFCLYAVVSVAARIVPILVRTLLSLFVHTPSVTELKADGSYLFNVIYPLFGLLMLGSYFAAMYYGFRFAASKVSYRTLKQETAAVRERREQARWMQGEKASGSARACKARRARQAVAAKRRPKER